MLGIFNRSSHRPSLAGRHLLVSAVTAASIFSSSLAAEAQNIPLIRDSEIEAVLSDYARPIFKTAGLGANKISMRIVRQYDINNDKLPCRIDVLYGYKTIRPQLACRLAAN